MSKNICTEVLKHTNHTPTISGIEMTVVKARVLVQRLEVLKQLVYMAKGTWDLEGMTDDKRLLISELS